MRGTTVVTSVAALLFGVLVPLSPAAAATGDGIPASSGSSQVVVGGGDGLSGPATRARIGQAGHLTLAPDGTVLAVANGALVRVDPATDRVSVVESYDEAQEHGAVDVAVLGTTTFLLTPWGLDRIDGDGARTRLWTGEGNSVDVGADGVAWVARSNGVTRVLPGGTAVPVPGTEVMAPLDIAVTDSGSTAYVLDHANQRYGIYEATADGVGPRVAGTGYRDDSLNSSGRLATAASMEAVNSLSLDGDTITVVSREYRLIASFPIGGVVTVRSTGDYSGNVDSVVGTTIATTYGPPESVVRITAAGTTRILGADPSRPWSPDGVLASDAYTTELRGAAPIDATRLVFVTASGMVREVDAAGRLRTRATLAPIATRGKVAVGPDGTAYVVDDAGHVVRVPSSGPPQTLPLTATATDVEVLPDGRLVVADSSPARVLIANGDGSGQSVLATLTGTPSDLGLDGDSVLVADDGLRRVGLDGTVSTLLTGGAPTAALRGHDGIWTGELHQPQTSAMVLHPGGGLGALRALFDVGRQAQSDAGDAVLVTRETSLLRVTDGAAVPEQPSPHINATPGEGRVTLTLDDGNPVDGIIRAKRGDQPPRDAWDGEPVGPGATVFRIGSDLITPGEKWTFAAFSWFGGSTAEQVHVTSYATAAVAAAAAEPDTTPPPPPSLPKIVSDHTQIVLSYDDPNPWSDQAALDFDRTVVRYSVGSTAPATPTEGMGLDPGSFSTPHYVAVPDPVRGQQYGLSVFALDLRGNFSRWSAVTQLDYQAPGAVTDVSVTPSYRSARVDFTEPTDPDYQAVALAVAAGEVAPTLPSDATWHAQPPLTASALAMDTTYTISLWTRDAAGNVSDPVSTTFRTLLDSTPPALVTGLTAEGGSYSITASWTNPTDADFAGPVVELFNPETGTATACPALNSTKTSCSWRLKGGATRTVRVRSKDVNGNLSEAAESTVTTLPDTNGTPTIPDPVTWAPVDPTTVTLKMTRPDAPDLSVLGWILRPSGQTTGYAAAGGLPTSQVNLVRPIQLPDAAQTYDLFVYATDLNGNRDQRVLYGVHGGPDPAGRPSTPVNVAVSSPVDNTIRVTWTSNPWSAPVSEWVATATAADGSTSLTVQVPGSATSLSIGDLSGRQSWSVRLYGRNDAGAGPSSQAQSVAVGDTTAPARVSGLTGTPAYDTTTLRWVNPSAFDLAKVVVLRRDRVSGALATVYSGRGTSVRATGLAPGRPYTFEVRSYDALGNVSPPTTLSMTQTAVSLSASSSVRYGTSVRASGAIYLSGKRLARRGVSLFAQRAGTTTWSRLATTTTSSTGYYAFSVRPSVNTRYRVGYAGAGAVGGSYSAVRSVTVAPAMSIRTSRTSLRRGRSVTLSTHVSPSHARHRVALQRWSGKYWITITWRTLTSSSYAAASIKPSARGYNSYRWYLPAHSDHRSSASAHLRVRVY